MPRTANRKKRPDGNYVKQITVGRKPDGKPIRKTFYAKTLKEIEQRISEFEQHQRQGTIPANEKMTFGELADLWINDYKPTIGISTRKMYMAILKNHLKPQLASIKLKELKPHSLQSIINNMAEKGYSEKTMKEVKIAAAQIIDIALQNDLLYRNVFSKVTIPHVEKEERRPLTQKEIDLITSTYQGHRMGVPAMLMLYCGLRRGELVALTWGDADLKAKLLTVNKAVCYDGNTPYVKTPKTKAGTRTVPIPDILLPILQGRRASSLMICPDVDGDMMTESAMTRAWESYQHFLNISAGGRVASRSRPKIQVIDNITPHMLRHTYATMLYDAGVDVKSAQKFLGHADISTTLKIYTHLSEQKEQQAISALNAHLSGAKKGEKPGDSTV